MKKAKLLAEILIEGCSAKMKRCIKKVEKTVEPQEDDTKKEAAIKICKTSVKD